MGNKKLVRDKIPEIIRKNEGRIALTHHAADEEYWGKLKEKLQEEVDEFMNDENEEELADILEVIHAICDHKKINPKYLELFRQKKAEERGGFKDKIILEGIK